MLVDDVPGLRKVRKVRGGDGSPKLVAVGDKGIERAIKHLKRKLASEGILRELKSRRHYLKPSVKRRKKQAEAAEAEKERVAKEAEAKVRADNCNRSRTVKATLDSGVRVATTGADGERVVLDDNARAAEMRRVQASIQQNCS